MTTNENLKRKAELARDNAFRDLAMAISKALGSSIAVTKGMFMLYAGPAKPPQQTEIMVHHAPAQLSELVRQLYMKQAQIEVAVNVLADMLAVKGVIDATDYMNECAKVAAASEKGIIRAILSEGAAAQASVTGGILKAN